MAERYHKWPISLDTLIIKTPIVIGGIIPTTDFIVRTAGQDFPRFAKEVLYCDNNKNFNIYKLLLSNNNMIIKK